MKKNLNKYIFFKNVTRIFAVISLLIFLFLIPVISAIDIALSKDSYFPGETLQAEIRGNFYSLTYDNIQIYEKGVPHSAVVIPGLIKKDDVYYYYAELPYKMNNYSLKIENSQYYEQGVLKSDTIEKSFSIKSSNQSSYLSISPGFINANKDFSIKLKSIEGSQDISLYIDSELFSNITLIEGTEKSIIIPFSVLKNEKSFIKILNYSLPVFASFEPVIISDEYSDLFFLPSEIKAKVIAGQEYYFSVLIKNNGPDISNIEIAANKNLKINPAKIGLLKANSMTALNLSIKIDSDKNNFTDTVIARFEAKSKTLPVFLELTKNSSEINLNGTSTTQTLSCYSIGDKCLENEICDGEITASLEGACCKGICTEKKSFDWRFYLGILFFILVLGIIAYLYAKSRKSSVKSGEEILKERSKEYNQRMKGGEVRKGLERY